MEMVFKIPLALADALDTLSIRCFVPPSISAVHFPKFYYTVAGRAYAKYGIKMTTFFCFFFLCFSLFLLLFLF